MNPKKLIKIGLLLLAFSNLTQFALSQDHESITNKLDVSGKAAITNNGISIIPANSLGKPAAIFDLSVGKRLRFEPQFKFSLKGKPWAFIFRWRYDLVRTDKFILKIGLNHGISFKNRPETSNGVTNNVIEAGRFLGGELHGDYSITNNISIGLFYLQAHGFDPHLPANTSFVSFNGNISDVTLFNDFYMDLKPQIYYLKLVRTEGTYMASEFDLGNRNFPLSISSVINKIIHTNIAGSQNFLWNVSLNYSFNF